MIRIILGVIVGFAVWTALWLGGNALLFPEMTKVVAAGGSYKAAGPLLDLIAWSALCSLAAGFVTALIAGNRARLTVLLMSLTLLATGVGVEVNNWSRLPLWYHLVFLFLLVPMCRAGRRIASRVFASQAANAS